MESSNDVISTSSRRRRDQSEAGQEGGAIAPSPSSYLSIPSPSEWLSRCNNLLDRYPLQTKMITSFCVSAFGSALGSYLSASAKENRTSKSNNGKCKAGHKPMLAKVNWVDVLAYAIHGGLINAPISHYWFEWLSANGPSSNTASVLVDQVVVQPPLLAFYATFRYLKKKHYTVALNLCSVAWTVYLSRGAGAESEDN
ncbi:hypothetical protein ACHAXT_001183 [Thalassiosira profunda]